MYRRILVALDHTKADESLLPHVATLASLTKAELLLVHVADGWAARNYDRLKLAVIGPFDDASRFEPLLDA